METSDKLFFTELKVQLVYHGIMTFFRDFEIRSLKMDVGTSNSHELKL